MKDLRKHDFLYAFRIINLIPPKMLGRLSPLNRIRIKDKIKKTYGSDKYAPAGGNWFHTIPSGGSGSPENASFELPDIGTLFVFVIDNFRVAKTRRIRSVLRRGVVI